jgi:hypothetical protein
MESLSSSSSSSSSSADEKAAAVVSVVVLSKETREARRSLNMDRVGKDWEKLDTDENGTEVLRGDRYVLLVVLLLQKVDGAGTEKDEDDILEVFVGV